MKKSELKELIREVIRESDGPIYTDAPEVQEIAHIAFPDYRGKKFKIDMFTGPMNLISNWDGGSRNSYVIVNMATGKTSEIPESGTPQSHPGGAKLDKLPQGFAIVKHTIFSGKDLGITIYVNSENMAKLLPQTEEISWSEKVVLTATRSLKSSYGGIPNFRFREANRDTGISEQEWNQAKESLIQKGMLNRAGSITDKGRNSIGNTQLYSLKKEKSSELGNINEAKEKKFLVALDRPGGGWEEIVTASSPQDARKKANHLHQGEPADTAYEVPQDYEDQQNKMELERNLPKDVNWRKFGGDEYLEYPEESLLIKTNVTIRITKAKYIESDGRDRSHGEKVLFYAFLNEPK